VLPFEVIQKLFDNPSLEAIVSLDNVPLAPTEILERDIVTSTLAYWEGPIGFNQGELIPVWALTVNNLMQGLGDEPDYEVESTSYIPVDPSYMSPLAYISTTVNLEAPAVPGQTLRFEALDASLPLTELGLDPSPGDGNPLNFALGTGDPDSYLYFWYLDEVTESARLVDGEGGVVLSEGGRVLDFRLPVYANVKDATATGNQRIILEVVDSFNGDSNNTSRAELAIQVVPPTYLPQLSGNE
jgi:hypothetical protein